MLSVDFCSPNPCENDGLCVMSADGKNFSCRCKYNYEGSTCQQGI